MCSPEVNGSNRYTQTPAKRKTHNVSINNFQKGVYVHSQCTYLITTLTLSPWSMCEKFMSCEGSRLSSISTLLWKHFKIASSANDDSLKHAVFHWNWNHFRLTLVALLHELMEWVDCGKIEMDHWSWRGKLFCYANGKFRFNVNFYRSQPTTTPLDSKLSLHDVRNEYLILPNPPSQSTSLLSSAEHLSRPIEINPKTGNRSEMKTKQKKILKTAAAVSREGKKVIEKFGNFGRMRKGLKGLIEFSRSKWRTEVSPS